MIGDLFAFVAFRESGRRNKKSNNLRPRSPSESCFFFVLVVGAEGGSRRAFMLVLYTVLTVSERSVRTFSLLLSSPIPLTVKYNRPSLASADTHPASKRSFKKKRAKVAPKEGNAVLGT